MERWKSTLALAVGIVFVAGSAWAQGSPGTSGSGAGGQAPGASPGTTPGAADKQQERMGTPGAGKATTPGAGTATTPGTTDRGTAATMDKEKDKDRMQADKPTRGRGMATGAGGNREHVRKAQEALKDKGHDPGPVDGMMGPKTRAAVRDFQKQEGIKESGQLDQETLSRLGVEARASATDTTSPAASPGAADKAKPAESSPSPSTSGAPSATPGASGAEKKDSAGQTEKK